MNSTYLELQSGGNPLSVREDRLPWLAEVDVIVFDCDGVLLDVRDSYSKTVAWTASTLVEAFTGARLPEALFDERLNFAYKRTGGMNSDWNLTYALVMKTLASSPDAAEIDGLAKRSLDIEDMSRRLSFIEENRVEAGIPFDGLYDDLLSFASKLDESGVESVDTELMPPMRGVKQALCHPGGVGESVVSTMFEEVFSGAALFEEAFGVPARFKGVQTGFVENEKVVVTDETLDQLEEIIGGNRFGVASGSPANTARYALGAALDRFSPDAQAWLDDVEEAEEATGRRGLGKPNPYLLTRSAESYQPIKRALYVGDTVADMLMAEKAGDRYLFAGVYGCVAASEEARQAFLKGGCDVVAHSVNDLPTVLRVARGEAP
jgi:HAD superfamily hydrolase (TIGR01549 family)